MFTPKTVARIGASTPMECLAEYSQMIDGTYYLELSSDEGVTKTEQVPDFASCVALCDAAKCQLVSYDYINRACYVRVSQAPVYEG